MQWCTSSLSLQGAWSPLVQTETLSSNNTSHQHQKQKWKHNVWKKCPYCIAAHKVVKVKSPKNDQCSTEGQSHQKRAPVLVVLSGKSLVFARKSTTSTGFTGAAPQRVSTSKHETLVTKFPKSSACQNPGISCCECSCFPCRTHGCLRRVIANHDQTALHLAVHAAVKGVDPSGQVREALAAKVSSTSQPPTR